MKKNPWLLTGFASLLFFCMIIFLLYFIINFDELSSEQAYRQMLHMNQKTEKNY
tara:strand:- start:891 stop:1052 length:162 start_codon:yes stop_codon:yes gene_type:complete